MIDPIRMVIVNIVASVILVIGLLVYNYLFPNKKINLLILIFLISIIPIISIFRIGAYESGDFNIHTYRSIEFYRSLTDGHFFPSWAGGLNATYGLPLFIFNYPLPYYVISFFHFLGFSFITSMKVFLAANFLLSGIFMYFCAKKLFKNNIAAFVTTIFYQFVPYHLIDLHFKIAIGEIMIFTFLPLLFFLLQKLWEEKKGTWFALASLSIALLIMSHVSLALFAMGLLFCYSIFLSFKLRNKHIVLLTFGTFILGSISSVYIWLTPFFLTKYTIVPKMTFNMTFPNFGEFLFSPWRLGFLFQGPHGEISILLGYTQIFVIITLFILLVGKKILLKQKPHVIFWLLAFLVTMLLMTPLSGFIWNSLPFLKATGGVQRLLLIAAFVSSVLAGYLSLHFLKKPVALWFLVGITIFSTILNWGQRRVIPEINDDFLIKHLWESTYKADGHYFANSRWRNVSDPWFTKLPTAHLKTLKGSAEIKELPRTSTIHTYIVNANTTIVLKESTLYFPGWSGFDNGKTISVQPANDGVITFTLPKGLHLIKLNYEDLFLYKVLKLISICGLLGNLFYLLSIFRSRKISD